MSLFLPRRRNPAVGAGCQHLPTGSAAVHSELWSVPVSRQRWMFPHMTSQPVSPLCSLPGGTGSSPIPGLCPTSLDSLSSPCSCPLGTPQTAQPTLGCARGWWLSVPSQSLPTGLPLLSVLLTKGLEQHLALWEERRSPWQLARQEDCARNLIFFFLYRKGFYF